MCVAVSCLCHLSHGPCSQHNQCTQRMEVQDDERAGTVQHSTHTPCMQAPPTALLYTHTHTRTLLTSFVHNILSPSKTHNTYCALQPFARADTIKHSSSAVSTIKHVEGLGDSPSSDTNCMEGYSRSWTAAAPVPTGHWLMM